MKKYSPILALAIATALTACGGSEEGSSGDSLVEGTKNLTEKAVETTKTVASDAVEGAKDAAVAAVEGTGTVAEKAQEAASGAVEAVKESTASAVEGAKDMAASAVDSTKEAASGAVDATKDMAATAVDKAKDTGAAATAAVASATSSVDAKALYAPCVACHGQAGETKALGVSAVIAGQPAEDLATKIKGYQDGSYGGAMASVMKGQVASLSADDVSALADLIAKF